MRYAILLLILTGCSQPCDNASCPRTIPPGCPTDPSGECDPISVTTCVYPNPLSSCESEICTCIDPGELSCTQVGKDGTSCAGAPSQSCGSAAPPDCAHGPGEVCACGSDNVWHCICSCYDAMSGCGPCPATFSPMLEGVGCTATGNTCSFTDGHSCTCTADATGSHFHCT